MRDCESTSDLEREFLSQAFPLPARLAIIIHLHLEIYMIICIQPHLHFFFLSCNTTRNLELINTLLLPHSFFNMCFLNYQIYSCSCPSPRSWTTLCGVDQCKEVHKLGHVLRATCQVHENIQKVYERMAGLAHSIDVGAQSKGTTKYDPWR